MNRLSVLFNGEVRLQITPETEEDKQLIQLAFNGRDVKCIKPGPEGAVILEMVKSEEKNKT